MMREHYYFAPVVTAGSAYVWPGLHKRGKWTIDARHNSTRRFGRERMALCSVSDERPDLVREIEADPECHLLGSSDELEHPLPGERAARARHFAETKAGVPMDWHKPTATLRDMLAGLVSHAMLAQRFEGSAARVGHDMRQRLIEVDASLDTPWSKVRGRDEIIHAFNSLNGFEPNLGVVRVRDFLNHAAAVQVGRHAYLGSRDMAPRGDDALVFAATMLGARSLNLSRRAFMAAAAAFAALATMRTASAAYGDNRTVLFTDAFPSSIDANYTNGWTGWGAMTWSTSYGSAGGVVQPNTNNVDCGIRRNTETFTADHWVQITSGGAASNSAYMGCLVRCHNSLTNDGSAYIATVGDTGGNGAYGLWESNAAGSWSSLGTGAWAGNPFDTADQMTEEAEGTTIRMGTAEGGADTQRLSPVTDATLGGSTYGKVGCYAWTNSGSITVAIDSLTGGSIGGAAPSGRLLRRRRS